MLSKKMAFSLMSLITIFALAFAASPALAANEITLALKDRASGGDDDGDYSPGMSGIQAVIGATVELKLTSKEKLSTVTGGAANVSDFVVSNTGTTALTVAAARVDEKTYTLTLSGSPQDSNNNAAAGSVTVFLAANKLTSVETGIKDHASTFITIHYVTADRAAPDNEPNVVSVERSDETTPLIVEDVVVFTVTLTEEPKGGSDKFTTDSITVTEATVVSVDFIGTEEIGANGTDGEGGSSDNPSQDNPSGPLARTGDTGYDYYKYAVRVKPKYEKTDPIKFTVKQLEDQYGNKSADPALKEKAFNVAKSAVAAKAKSAGTEVGIANDLIIPAGGALIVAKDDGLGTNSEEKTSDSLIVWPGDNKEAATTVALRKPSGRTYNMVEASLLDLETFLINGGTIDLKAGDKVVISEIMWATDDGAGAAKRANRQWIEIMNTTDAAIKTKDYKLVFYTAGETPPAMTPAVAATATTAAKPAALPAGVADRVGTLYKGAYWSIAGKGQSGRITTFVAVEAERLASVELISMERQKTADGSYEDGTMSSAWMQSVPPSLNFTEKASGLLIGSPGVYSGTATKAAKDLADAKAKSDETKAKVAADTSVMMPKVGQIYISEVMFAGGGTLPQWIEISNGSRTEEVNLSGWTLTVDNAVADADVSVGASIKFTIPEGTKIMPSGQNDTPSTILVVTEAGRNNVDGSGQVLNLWTANQTELILAGVTKRRYSLLSDMAFEITLAPPAPMATKLAATATAAETAAAKAADALTAKAHADATDMVGNLGADGAAAWPLLMSDEGGRSSIIRTHVEVSVGPAEPNDGTMMDGWALASDTAFAQITHVRVSSYYGAMNDVGTPGFRAGGALPVELSHFRPARDKATGAVVITWSTQSELNNAGFFIKRSQQKDGEFKVINATMVPGAGTTSEKQFYTYTDTTAQPNVVYYYQIEDVSLDGNRQTLTRGIRLKGHVGAAGKATTLWGEIKAFNE